MGTRARRWATVAAAALALVGAAAAGLLLRRAPEPPAGPARWFRFDPPREVPAGGDALDLRRLNEAAAGEGGFIAVRDGAFVHSRTGRALRFWGVNGPPAKATGPELRRCARLLARYGVNLVRLHAPVFDAAGEADPERVRHAIETVEALKEEGIYSYFSIYYPLWLRPEASSSWLSGYDGKTHPFGALMFDPAFQARYRSWWSALLLTPSPRTGRRLVDEPAVAGVEMQNEDSLLFWTFDPARVPDAPLRLLEGRFGGWLAARHGSPAAALAAWGTALLPRDDPGAGRIALRPLAALVAERTQRDQEQARFLVEVQRRFYAESYAYLRSLGFRGIIGASNWQTASPEILGPLEVLGYTEGDFIDRHAYRGCARTGPDSAWALRPGQTYADRCASRLEAEEPSRGRDFLAPVMDVHYQDKPSMLSEAAWERPNRYRSEAELQLAAYGALQHTDAVVQYELDGCGWSASPRPEVQQPWTLASPATMGQFPAAALIFRQGLVAPAETVATVRLDADRLFRLQGTPLPQGAHLDEEELRRLGGDGPPAGRLDPLLHLVGRSAVLFTEGPGSVETRDLRSLVDHDRRVVTSSTGELRLDYGKGLLVIDAPRAQGASGALLAGGTIATRDLLLTSGMELAHVVAVSLDGLPLSSSGRMLLQAMSEERPEGFSTRPAAGGKREVLAVGGDPWLVAELSGTVRFRRPDAASLRVTPLGHDGLPAAASQVYAGALQLAPTTMYYLVTR